jgi:hypothetical protein
VGATSVPGNYWDGKIDEVRVLSTALSAVQIKYEYANINSADHELTWGAQETPPAAGGSAQVIIATDED